MISLKELCNLLCMPDEVSSLIYEIAGRMDWAALRPHMELFYSRDTWMDGWSIRIKKCILKRSIPRLPHADMHAGSFPKDI